MNDDFLRSQRIADAERERARFNEARERGDWLRAYDDERRAGDTDFWFGMATLTLCTLTVLYLAAQVIRWAL